jgi:hypothetical protein
VEGDTPERLADEIGNCRLQYTGVSRCLSDALWQNRTQSFMFLFSRTNFDPETYDIRITEYICWSIADHSLEV